MAKLRGASAERLADHFISYLFRDYQGTQHVRRIASWVGLLVLGIERLAGSEWGVPRSRQLEFRYGAKRFKGKYDHTAGSRGGITIVEVLPGRGSPEGRTVATITTLAEAEAFYNDAETLFARVMRPGRAQAG